MFEVYLLQEYQAAAPVMGKLKKYSNHRSHQKSSNFIAIWHLLGDMTWGGQNRKSRRKL
jgi:hypothetical protein